MSDGDAEGRLRSVTCQACVACDRLGGGVGLAGGRSREAVLHASVCGSRPTDGATQCARRCGLAFRGTGSQLAFHVLCDVVFDTTSVS